MKGKRTGIDFSKHTHRIEIFKCGEKEIRIDHFQVGNSRTNYIQFINTDEVMTVTGDFGNWVFCRPFVPSKKGNVSESYWIEKLQIASEQKLERLDLDAIGKEIEGLLRHGLKDYGYKGKQLKEAKEWYKELLESTDDELSYLSKAYRDHDRPSFIDSEDIPSTKKVPGWLKVIFDAFEEICSRIKE